MIIGTKRRTLHGLYLPVRTSRGFDQGRERDDLPDPIPAGLSDDGGPRRHALQDASASPDLRTHEISTGLARLGVTRVRHPVTYRELTMIASWGTCTISAATRCKTCAVVRFAWRATCAPLLPRHRRATRRSPVRTRLLPGWQRPKTQFKKM